MNATLTWLGHATFQLTLPDGRIILIDPWMTGNPSCPPAFRKPTRCDFVLLTHGHSDHVGEVATLVKLFNPVVVGNYDLSGVLSKEIGNGRFEGMNTGGTLAIDGIRVALTRAFHSSSVETSSGLMYGGMPNGVVVAVEGLATVYHAGDTDVFSDMTLIAKLFAPKICILPIGDRFTMGPKGAALAAELLQPAAILPGHYKTFPLLTGTAEAFHDALPSVLRDRLFVPAPGDALAWTASGLHLP